MSVAVLFPGQGSQYPGMLDAWLDHPASAAVVRQASDLLGADVVATCQDAAALERTDITQLAVFTADVAAWRVLEAEGVNAVAMAGHSLGEFAALVACGATRFDRAFGAVRVRALAMQRACTERPGAMLAVLGAAPEDVEAICAEAAGGDDLVVANANSPQQTVLSGTVAAIERAEAAAKARRARATRLRVAGAFHSPLMAPAMDEVAEAVGTLELADPRCPLVENSSAEPTTDAAVLDRLLRRHLVSPVRWAASMEAMVAMGAQAFVEAGPGTVLTGLAKRCAPGAEALAAGSPDEAAAVARTLAGAQ